MVANDKIKVTLGDGLEAKLDKDTPNIKEFVKFITANRESIDTESIEVEGPSPEFDAQSFKEVVAEVVSEYLDAISIEEQQYSKAIEKASTGFDEGSEEGVAAGA